MIKKSLLFRDFSSSTSLSDANASSKALSLTDFQSKATNRWNQSNLNYFNPYLDIKAHGKGKVVLLGKNVYYKNVVFFVQYI